MDDSTCLEVQQEEEEVVVVVEEEEEEGAMKLTSEYTQLWNCLTGQVLPAVGDDRLYTAVGGLVVVTMPGHCMLAGYATLGRCCSDHGSSLEQGQQAPPDAMHEVVDARNWAQHLHCPGGRPWTEVVPDL